MECVSRSHKLEEKRNAEKEKAAHVARLFEEQVREFASSHFQKKKNLHLTFIILYWMTFHRTILGMKMVKKRRKLARHPV